MVNFYTVTKKIGGKDIKAQFNGISANEAAIDESYIDGSANLSMEKYSNYIFENVIVEPKLSIADFGAEKIGKEETKVINGKKYVAKFMGIPFALRTIDNCYIDGTENISMKKLAKQLFEKVIVKPEKLTADDFETMKDYQEVVAFARKVMQGGEVWDEFSEIRDFGRDVMQGNFREEKDTVSAARAGKE